MRIKDMVPWGSHSREVQSGEAEHPVSSLQQELNRVFDEFWTRFDRPFDEASGFAAPGMAASDVVETDDSVEVSVELPGLDDKDLEVTLSGDTLTIKGEKKVERQDEKKGFYLSERSYGSVFRAIPLPPGVDMDKAEAKFKNGVLTVTLPKSAEAASRSKKVEVTAA